jgi:hypothetical protein
MCILLGTSPASDCDLPTFRNLLSVPSSKAGCRVLAQYSTPSLWSWNWQSVPKRRHTTIWRRGNTQKNTYNIQNTAKVWNQERINFLNVLWFLVNHLAHFSEEFALTLLWCVLNYTFDNLFFWTPIIMAFGLKLLVYLQNTWKLKSPELWAILISDTLQSVRVQTVF